MNQLKMTVDMMPNVVDNISNWLNSIFSVLIFIFKVNRLRYRKYEDEIEAPTWLNATPSVKRPVIFIWNWSTIIGNNSSDTAVFNRRRETITKRNTTPSRVRKPENKINSGFVYMLSNISSNEGNFLPAIHASWFRSGYYLDIGRMCCTSRFQLLFVLENGTWSWSKDFERKQALGSRCKWKYWIMIKLIHKYG